MSDAMPIFRSVRTGTPEAQALRRSRNYWAGWLAGWREGAKAVRELADKFEKYAPTRRDRLEEEGDRLGISRPEIGRIWVRMCDDDLTVLHVSEIDWHFVFLGERNPFEEETA